MGDHKADGTEPIVAMEMQPLVEPAKAADTAKREEMSEAEAKDTTTVGDMKDKEERGGGVLKGGQD